jgi:thimet oligopeptidase
MVIGDPGLLPQEDHMPDESSAVSVAAQLTVCTPAELGLSCERAIQTAHALVDRVKSGELFGLDLLDAYDEATAALDNAMHRVELISVSHPDSVMRDAADAGRQAVAKVATDLSLDRELYDALAALDPSGFDRPTRYYVERTLLAFRRAGVDRDEATRARVRELQEELVAIGQDFDRNIRTDTRTARLEPNALAGLPEDYVRAHPVGDDGRVAITTEYPDLVPLLTYATDAAAREQLWRLHRQRAFPANIDVLNRMLARRYELARLLGYPSWAEYAAEDKMIGSAANIADFIDRITVAAGGRATREYDDLLARKRVDLPEAPRVDRWDVAYLEDHIKKERFALDTQALRPYFEYGRVKAGLMAVAERLFGITFHRRTDVPVWHDQVECYEVLDGERMLGRIFLDMHPRPDKFNHNACFAMTRGKAGVRAPECALVCNLPRPGDEPALLLHSDVVTFFHEFGHLLHCVLAGHVRWSGSSGFATEWDFVEAPSQLLEEWVRDAETLATFAVHYQTGEPLPAEMVDRLRAADEFGKRMFVLQQMSYAALSFELYNGDPEGVDPMEVERRVNERMLPFAHVDNTYLPLSFGHLDGYSAVYCTYMWSLVIAKDLFTVFSREGLLSSAAAGRYREAVLAAGGSAPAADLVQDFLGRPYTFDAYQAWLDAD